MRNLLILIFLSLSFTANSQSFLKDNFINTKEGMPLVGKRLFIAKCREKIKKGADSQEALELCACNAQKLDGYFTNKQYRQALNVAGDDWLNFLIDQDSVLKADLQNCFQAAWNRNVFFSDAQVRSVKEGMKENLKKSVKDSLDEKKLDAYCDCAVNVMKERKVPAKRMEELSDPNSFLYNEIAYRCGGVPVKKVSETTGWKPSLAADVHSVSGIDTVNIITVNAMTKLKVKIGSFVHVWLLDSGATDLLISDSLATQMMGQHLFTEKDFLGNATYNMANGKQVNCKVYKINNVQIGKFTIDNIMLATSPDVQEYLLGKSFLNKFSRWTIDNRRELLILEK
ncbi:retropepsin-like aspartic protease [Chitinophaga vietnamensis]|uniref:retropepsin-like aspartic protease n=1 Tax=Chitinophaga vietnamensis TaxID=2593957 RepID=UPI0011789497|nr:retropepsin-like aspartic protease [Chitinophaga vietnamensis]